MAEKETQINAKDRLEAESLSETEGRVKNRLWNRLWQLINRDVADEDEANQFFVMMRLYYIITAVYIIIFDILAVWSDTLKYMPVLVVWLPLHILSFFTTYWFRRRVVFHLFSTGILTWFVLAVHLMGWDYGAQYFIYPLMVISFFATYKNYIGKAFYIIFLFTLHTCMFFYATVHQPTVSFSADVGNSLQVLHTATLFICMFVICLMFSNSNQSALEKLSFYNKKLKREAETDILTGLYNRRYMYTKLTEAIQNGISSGFTVVMSDIDFFKKVNDTMGHECGDKVLQEVASYLKSEMEGKGLVCRWGGEEFLFCFPRSNVDDTYERIENMRKHIETMAIPYNGQTVHVTMTFGIAQYDQKSNMAELIHLADDKLYTGKKEGRNRVVK